MRNPSTSSMRTKGSVLLMVLWMLIILGMLGLSYTSSVRTQLQAAHTTTGRSEAYWAARGGIEKAIAMLSEADLSTLTADDPLFDDRDQFADQGVGPARFSLVLPPRDQTSEPAFGLLDESSRFNVNTIDKATLLLLPAMTESRADSLLDWRDGDEIPRPFGAEIETYMALDDPYPVRNGRLASLRELVRVQSWGPVFKAAYPDPYSRFLPEPEEDEESEVVDPGDAQLLLDSFTAWSVDGQLAPDGQKKMVLASVAQAEIQRRITGITAAEAKAIVEYRAKNAYKSALDLLDVRNPPPASSPNASTAKTFTLKRAGEIIDYFTTESSSTTDATKPGLININTASYDTLLLLAVRSDLAAAAIERERKLRGAFKGPGNIAGIDGVDEKTFKNLYPRITARSTRFHVTSRGFEPSSGATVGIEASLSVEADGVKIAYWREF